MAIFRAYASSSEDEDDIEFVASASGHSSDDDRRVESEIDAGHSQSEEESEEEEEEVHQTDASQASESGPDGEEPAANINLRPKSSVQFDPAVKSPSRRRSVANDTTIIPRARELGVDSQKVHVMQTALFRVPEEEAALRTVGQPTAEDRRRSRLLLGLSRKHSRDSDGEGLRADPGQRVSFGQDIEPIPVRPSRKYARVESSASAVTGNEGLFADAGLALGRSFRVGWGPGGKLIHLGALCGPYTSKTTTANSSIVHKSVMPLVAIATDDASTRASNLLSHHLKNTPIEKDADGVPFADPSRHLSFKSCVAQFPATDRSFETSLFRLGHALFDPIDLRLADSVSPDVRNCVLSLRRKAALSRWLQEAIATSVDAELRDNPGADWTTTVFTLLTGNQVEKACEVAMDSGSVKLASLIAQYPGDDEFRGDLRTQLALWREQRIDAHIDEPTRKIYALLAGIVDTLEGSKGKGREHCPDVKIAQDLSWKRAFGLHLWFCEPLESTIAEVFESYNGQWTDDSSGVSPPIPWYREKPRAESEKPPWTLPTSAEPPDALYSLIQLYADPACSLSTILKCLSFSESPVDYRLPWHLYIILSRCLGVRDFPDRETPSVKGDAAAEMSPGAEGHSPSADLLANSYALQLEQAGLIQEAAFVLLHIEGSAGRVKAIRELLCRSAPQLDDWMTSGLVGSLKLPMAWVNEAKAIYALDRGKIFDAYELYIMAGLHSAAHDLAVLELAPDAVMRKDVELLKELLGRFKVHPVDGWHTRGKVLMDYAHAVTRLQELYQRTEESGVSDDEAVELEHLGRSVPKLIAMLPDVLRDRSDARHNAAVTEMTTQLTKHLDRVKPLAIHQSSMRPSLLSGGARLHNIQATAYERFLLAVEVAVA